MSEGVKIILIICATIIILDVISCLKFEYKSDKKDNQCKHPTYPAPKGLTRHDNSELENMRED